MKQSLIIVVTICLLLAKSLYAIHQKELACRVAGKYCCKTTQPVIEKEKQPVLAEPFTSIINVAGYN